MPANASSIHNLIDASDCERVRHHHCLPFAFLIIFIIIAHRSKATFAQTKLIWKNKTETKKINPFVHVNWDLWRLMNECIEFNIICDNYVLAKKTLTLHFLLIPFPSWSDRCATDWIKPMATIRSTFEHIVQCAHSCACSNLNNYIFAVFIWINKFLYPVAVARRTKDAKLV